MAIAAIEQWLKAPDYGSGVQLYVQYGSNAFLKDCFSNKQLPLSRLVKELSALNENSAPIKKEVKVLVVEEPKPVTSVDKRMVKPDPSVPKEIAELEKKWREHYASADALHRDLLQTATKAKRKQMALEVVQNMDMVRDIWYRIQYWRENGVLYKEQVDVVVQAEETLLDTINKVRNLPTYITKAKKQVPGIKDVKRLQSVMANIDQKEAELKAAWDRLKFLDAKIKELGI
jgi:uncharacterized coiled-coil DUF342 family protein